MGSLEAIAAAANRMTKRHRDIHSWRCPQSSHRRPTERRWRALPRPGRPQAYLPYKATHPGRGASKNSVGATPLPSAEGRIPGSSPSNFSTVSCASARGAAPCGPVAVSCNGFRGCCTCVELVAHRCGRQRAGSSGAGHDLRWRNPPDGVAVSMTKPYSSFERTVPHSNEPARRRGLAASAALWTTERRRVSSTGGAGWP